MTTPSDGESATERWTWQQIAEDVRAQIEHGEHAPGDRLPPRRDLMDRYGVADRTVARALHQLRDEGWIVARSTAGWLVRGQRTVIRSARNRLSRGERAAGLGAFSTDCHTAGLTPQVRTEIRVTTAGDDLAGALRIDPRDEVCIRDRVMYGDDEPLQLARSALPRSITRGTVIEEHHTGPGGVYARLEEAGYSLENFTERVVIGRADEQEARQLGISRGAPVFRVRRCAFSDGTPIEVNDLTLPGDRFELLYELPAS